MKIGKFALSLVMVFALQACGGGGGGAGGTGGTGAAPGSFTVSATTAAFTSREGGALPTPQVLRVHLLDNSAAVLGAAYVPPQTQPSWLNITITGTAPDYDVTLSITTTALSPVSLSTAFTLGTADANGKVLYTQTVQATLTIIEPVGVNQSVISDNFVLGQSGDSTSSTVNITADPSIHWLLVTSAPWITSSVTGAAGGTSATITVDASSLPVGTATGTITVTDSADPTDTATVSVTATVATPTLTVAPPTITLGGTDGLSQTPQSLNIALNTGGNTYPWSATLVTNTGGNWLTIDTAAGSVGGSGVAPNVNADYSLVSGGSYSGTIQVQATVDGVILTQTVPVTLNKEQDWLYVSADGVAFSQFPSRSVLTRTLQVTSSEGRTDIPWSAQSNQSWLSVTSSGLTGDSLTLTANPSGLTPNQEYIANVTISSSDGSIGNTQQVRVGLWVGSGDPGDVDLSGTFSALVTNPVEPEVYVTTGGSDVLVYNVYTGTLLRTLATSLAQTAQITISSDGTTLFVSDATNLEVVSINPTTGASIQHYPWGSTVSLPDLAYARPSGHPILVLGNGSIYDVASGNEFQASYGQESPTFYFNVAVDAAAHFLYTQDRGLSPSTLTQYTLKYTALTADGLIVTQGPSTFNAGSNGQSVCASADGSKVYTADGAPYVFSAFSSSNDLQQLQTLQATAYPGAAVCAWNGLFVGGAEAYYDPVDVWVYEANGVQLATLNMHPAAEHSLGPLALSGDDTRVIGVTGLPSLDIHSIPSP